MASGNSGGLLGRLLRRSSEGADSVFVGKIGEDPEREQQQLRIRRLVSWLVLIFAAAGVLTLVASCVATVRSTAGWTAWLVPLACLVICAVLYLLDRRLSDHPPMSVEVPVNLEPVLKEMTIACVDIDRLSGQLFDTERATQVLGGVHARTDESIEAAGEALTAERSGDIQRSVELREQIRIRAQAVLDLRDEMLVQAGEAVPYEEPVAYDPIPQQQQQPQPMAPAEPAGRSVAGAEPTVDPWQYRPDQTAQPAAGYPQAPAYPDKPISSPSVAAGGAQHPAQPAARPAGDPGLPAGSGQTPFTDGAEGDSSPNRL
ncbi:hypothetical protein [Fodinicola acaciae]|uniref:hypothetical protein n=1 Tax=Fodinicola acaciae TaxID=2681555 RepID=UPI0013D7393F|nr:hypothetical protein [Fodinicola acaciae]